MALIKCPSCGHAVLSVASQCPQCSAVLTKSPIDLTGSGELKECRGCGRAVLSRAPECANCGIHHPTRSYAGGIAVMVVGLLAAAGWYVTKDMKRPTREAVLPAAIVTRANATPADSLPAPVLRSTDSTLHRETVTALPPRPVTPDSATLTQARTVADWANVRQEPRLDASVVKVLRPGQQIEVAGQQGKWWAVYAEGRRLGYVSGTLLVSEMRKDSEATTP